MIIEEFLSENRADDQRIIPEFFKNFDQNSGQKNSWLCLFLSTLFPQIVSSENFEMVQISDNRNGV